MGGVFGVVSKEDCVVDLFYGTDFHSHLGTRRGGLAVRNSENFIRFIHNIENAQFRSKFDDDVSQDEGPPRNRVHQRYRGPAPHHRFPPRKLRHRHGGPDQQHQRRSWRELFEKRTAHFSETTGDGFNPTEVTASIIDTGESIVEGIRRAQELIDGSCSLLLLTEEGIYAGRDRLGRTPLDHRREGRLLLRDTRNERLSEPGLPVETRARPGRDRADHARRDRAEDPARR